MDRVSLQFQGVRNQDLLVVILVVVVLVLVGAGVWQLIRRRWRYGLTCLTAAMSPVALALFLAGEAIWGYRKNRSRAALAPLIPAGLLAAGTIAAVLFIASTSGSDGSLWSPGAFWLSMLGLWVPMAIGVFYAAVFAHLGTRRLSTLMLLRCLAIVALLLVLFKPSVSIAPDLAAFKPYLPILVDRSGSMSTPPKGLPGVRTRYEQVLQMLAIEKDKLNKNFRVAWYQFGKDIQQAEGVEALKAMEPTGENSKQTDIAAAIRGAASHFSADQVPGILLLSDGVHNASSLERLQLAVMDTGLPVFAVGVGSKTDESAGGRNIELAEVNVPTEAIKNNVTSIRVRVRINGFAGDPGELRLREEGTDQPVAIERLWTDKPTDTVSVDLKWTPKSVGLSPKDANISSAVRKLWLTVPVKEGESVKADNEVEVHVLVTEPRLRVLYVEGRMRPEYRFLKRLLDTDQNVQYVALVRIAENRFWSYGHIDGQKLTDLPTTDSDFERLDVIVLGSLDRSFLEPRTGPGQGRMNRIYEWVKKGGGLLMLGGMESFGPGGYTNTDIEKVLPVVIGGRSQPQETTQFVPQLTALGEKHPIFESIEGYFYGPGGSKPRDDLPKLPDLMGCVTVEKAKDSASILAVHPTRKNAAGPLVVLAVQPFGAGRTAAFTPDTTWQWYLPLRGKGADSPYERFWGQLIRWLAKVDTKSKENKPSVLLRIDHAYIQMGQTIKLTARVQDERGQAVSKGGAATCTITRADGKGDPDTVPLSPEADGKLFSGSYRAPRDGEYKVKVVAYDAAGKALGDDELKLAVAPYLAEMARVALDEVNLREIATRSHGFYAEIPALPEVIDQIMERQKRLAGPVPKPHVYPPWDWRAMTLLFLLFVGMLSAEWIMRRNWQLH